MLDSNLIEQVKGYLQLLEREVVISISKDKSENSKNLENFVEEIAKLSDKVSIKEEKLKFTPSFMLSSDIARGITFAGVPLGHELESFILAILQVGGRTPKIEEKLIERIKNIDKEYNFETVVSLTCHNCPEVVQALNIMSVLNPKISHTMIDGSFFADYVEEFEVMAVPATILNGESFNNGKISLNKILDKLTGKKASKSFENLKTLDMLVIGGGVAGATSAIYAARKGLDVAIISKKFGGQVEDTLGIENITGIKYTEGPKYMEDVRRHLQEYKVKVFDEVEALEIVEGTPLKVKTTSGEISTKTLVIATGAKWKLIGIPGETEFKNKGVSYCTHCDGPLYKGKRVAVIGGGNSGVESAIDLSNMAKEVILLEFLPHLNADDVLQEKLREIKNIKVITNARTTALKGNGKVESIEYEDRENNKLIKRDIEGCFIQVGLVPITEWIKNLDKNNRGEIITNSAAETNITGVYAAGDCTDSLYKQIVIAEGSGATAALSAYNYLMRK